MSHICARTRNGKFQLRRITISKRMQAKLNEVRNQTRRRRHQCIPEQGRWLASVVRGHMAYYSVPVNGAAVSRFRSERALVPLATASQPKAPPHVGAHVPP